MTIRYDKVITSKVSIEQFDKLHNHASALGKDVSDVLREFVDGLDQNELEILKMIDYHEFHIQQLKQKLDAIKSKKKEEKEEEIKKEEEELQKNKNTIVMNNITNVASQIIKEVGDKFQSDLTSDDKELIESAKKDSLKFIRKEINKINGEEKDGVVEKVTHYINRLYFKVDKKDLV